MKTLQKMLRRVNRNITPLVKDGYVVFPKTPIGFLIIPVWILIVLFIGFPLIIIAIVCNPLYIYFFTRNPLDEIVEDFKLLVASILYFFYILSLLLRKRVKYE